MQRCLPNMMRAVAHGNSRSRRWCTRGLLVDAGTYGRRLRVARLDNDLKGVVNIEINNPKANALGLDLISELEGAIQDLSRDKSVRAVVLSSAVPGVFCAGADLKERAKMSEDAAEAFVTRLRTLTSMVAGVPAPTIAAVEGAAYGGGLELMLACDLRVAGENATMGLTETSLGIIPGAGGTQRLPRLIGVMNAKELIFTARRFDAARALDLGIVGKVVEAGQALGEAYSLARDIAQQGPLAVRAAKVAIDEGVQLADVEQGMSVERTCYAQVLRTRDRNEGLKAFQERRTPDFSGG